VLTPACDLSRGLLETSERDAEVVVPSYLVSTKWVQQSLTPQEKAQAWDFPVGQGVAASGGLDKEGGAGHLWTRSHQQVEGGL
jgi:hypothetical protein